VGQAIRLILITPSVSEGIHRFSGDSTANQIKFLPVTHLEKSIKPFVLSVLRIANDQF
jgi:hypothetical protein